MGMARPEWTYLIDGIIDNHGSAQEFHRALVEQGFVVINKSGSTPESVFNELFDYMGSSGQDESFTTKTGKPIKYLPLHLDADDVIRLASKQGLPQFNTQLAHVASTFTPWVNRDRSDTLRLERILHVCHAETDEEIIRARLDYDLRFGNTDLASIIIRKTLARFGNPPGRFDAHNTPSIVPIFNFTYALPDGFEDLLKSYDPRSELSHNERTTILLCRSIVNLVHNLKQSHGQINPTQFIVAGDLRPYTLLGDGDVDPWMQYGPNSELLYVYNSLNVIPM